MVSPVRGNPTSSSPSRTAACMASPAFPSQQSSAPTSLRSSGSLPQPSSSSPLRSSGAHSAARWNNSSICAQRSGVKLPLPVLHLLVQPGFRHPQVAPHGNHGYVQRLGYFFHREPTEIAEFDGLAFSRIQLLKGVEPAVEGHEVPAPLFPEAYRLIEWHFQASALAGFFPARVVHQNLAHQSCRHSKEMRAALPCRIRLIDQPHVSLVDQRRWLQGVPLAFFAQVAGGKLAEFPVDERRKLIKSPLVTFCPFGQQKCHFVGIGHSFRVDNAALPSWADYTPPSPPRARFCLAFARSRKLRAMIVFC